MHQLSANEYLREVVLCLDNDDAGQQAAERISQGLRDKGYSVSTLFPADATLKDWNEALVQSHVVEIPEEMEVQPCSQSFT
jgi:DNA primase